MIMNETTGTEQDLGNRGGEQVVSAVFAQMVVQQANMALLLLGKTPHPQTGRTMHDLEGARMFIDQLEMLEAKTKGNLTKEEQSLLKQSLMTLHLAFVEAAESPAAAPGPDSTPAAADAPGEPGVGSPETKPASGSPSPEEESKKKFSKKY